MVTNGKHSIPQIFRELPRPELCNFACPWLVLHRFRAAGSPLTKFGCG